MKNCSVCGKTTKIGDTSTTGILFSPVKPEDDATDDFKESIKLSYGKYSTDKGYCVCYECWFKSLGIKP